MLQRSKKADAAGHRAPRPGSPMALRGAALIILFCCARMTMLMQLGAQRSAVENWLAQGVPAHVLNGRMGEPVPDDSGGPYAMGAAAEVATSTGYGS